MLKQLVIMQDQALCLLVGADKIIEIDEEIANRITTHCTAIHGLLEELVEIYDPYSIRDLRVPLSRDVLHIQVSAEDSGGSEFAYAPETPDIQDLQGR